MAVGSEIQLIFPILYFVLFFAEDEPPNSSLAQMAHIAHRIVSCWFGLGC